jgi:hypothetical protein
VTEHLCHHVAVARGSLHPFDTERLLMKTFISWSGETSRLIAQDLREWLPPVVQTIEPWMSDRDILPGKRWNDVLSHQLSETYTRPARKAGQMRIELTQPFVHSGPSWIVACERFRNT